MNILVIGAHADDPEAGCGGFSIMAADQGHSVSFLYLASGLPEQLTDGRSACQVREEEARAACSICGADPTFFRYADMDVPCDRHAVDRLTRFMEEAGVHLVLAHWPVDYHPDHQAAGVMATQAVFRLPNVILAYYEEMPGKQTRCFQPNAYVDISAVAARKKQSVECYVSQNIHQWWGYHDVAERWHGHHLGVERAEAFHVFPSTSASDDIPFLKWA